MNYKKLEKPVKILKLKKLKEKKTTYAKASNTDLVVVKDGKNISVLYGRCLHRGALLSDGSISGKNIICGLHYWDYRYDTGVSEYNNKEVLFKFKSATKDGNLFVDLAEIKEFEKKNPSPFKEEEYLGKYADTHPENTEPFTGYIKNLSKNGLKNYGHHGPTVSMGVDRNTLPKWEDIQYLPAQLSTKPLMDDDSVSTKVVIGKNAKKPLEINIPIFVSDMSFGALSKEAKISLSKGAELVGTGICSGEGGMLPEEQESNSKYFYELASGQFGFSWDKIKKAQAFHFKGGQGAKTGTGGHLPGNKVTPEIAKVRGLKIGEAAISPATFTNLKTVKDFKDFSNEVRERTSGIPIGFKIAASHIEKDIDFVLEAGADYIILDGRGGGTGAAPSVIRDNINIPTIPALARARKHLDKNNASDVTLIITGGLRVPEDFTKALMLGADAIAISNSALQAIGCLGMRACSTNNCPVGVATQKDDLRARLIIEKSAKQLFNFLNASNELIKVISRSCGYDDIVKFNQSDLTTFNYDMYKLTGISYGGVLY
ncbi:MAG: glutamate synthase-related protein [Melioribacteraceae bacterium]